MKRLCHLLILGLVLCATGAFGDTPPTRVYVWDFNTRDSLEKTDLPNKLTYEFEEALFNCKGFQVLERRRMDRLIDHAKNERSVSQVSSNDLATLTIRGAQLIAFGDVFDDRESGQVKVTVTLENFEGEKKMIVSALMQRGLVNDAASRTKAMKSLVEELCGGAGQHTDVLEPQKPKVETKPEAQNPSPKASESPGVTMSPNDFPGFGKPWLIKLDSNSPKRGGMGAYKEILVKVNQGDRLRIEAEPVGGASMRIRFEVLTGTDDKLIERPRKTGTLDWTMTKGIPGDSARVRIYSDVLGQTKVTVSKAN
jgi:hypothetical protein